MFAFDLQHTVSQGAARAGRITTAHGSIDTPIFMPVGTQGTVKGVHQHELKEDIGAQIILGNTYHLFERPGLEVLEGAGGLHGFTGWDRPILTDSGGYQVYSLAKSRKITEEGVTFQSALNGDKHFFTPEFAIDLQRSIGADIIMAFDECTPYPCAYNYAKRSMEMTHRWLQRCCAHFDAGRGKYGYEQTLFPIVQGSTYPDLRKASAEAIAGFERPGNAIGGLSVGEPHPDMYGMTEVVCDILPEDKPRYLMGVGTPANILESIDRGIDMFDCVLPSRNARHGMLYTAEGRLNFRNAKWRNDFSPIDANSTSKASRFYSKAYLHHLIRTQELLGRQVATLHNLSFYLWLVTEARRHILAGTWKRWKADMVERVDRKL